MNATPVLYAGTAGGTVTDSRTGSTGGTISLPPAVTSSCPAGAGSGSGGSGGDGGNGGRRGQADGQIGANGTDGASGCVLIVATP